jgi:hypothetical protein
MRTSIEIPDHLFKKLKIKVVEKNITMKAFFINLVERELESTSLPNPIVKKRVMLKSLRNKGKDFNNSLLDKMREDLNI